MNKSIAGNWYENYYQKKINKLKELIDDDNTPEYKKKQLQIKLYKLESKVNLKIFWNSSEKGTYRKPKVESEN